MKVDFTVHGVRRGHVAVDALVDGTKQRLLADGVEVELTTDTGRSVTLPFYGAAAAEAEQIFTPDSKVCFTVEKY